MSALALLLIIVVVVLIWQVNLRSRDLAIRTARHICETQGLQFLDGTAALQSIRPVLGGDHGPGIKRTYTFDYSEDNQLKAQHLRKITPLSPCRSGRHHLHVGIRQCIVLGITVQHAQQCTLCLAADRR